MSGIQIPVILVDILLLYHISVSIAVFIFNREPLQKLILFPSVHFHTLQEISNLLLDVDDIEFYVNMVRLLSYDVHLLLSL